MSDVTGCCRFGVNLFLTSLVSGLFNDPPYLLCIRYAHTAKPYFITYLIATGNTTIQYKTIKIGKI